MKSRESKKYIKDHLREILNEVEKFELNTGMGSTMIVLGLDYYSAIAFSLNKKLVFPIYDKDIPKKYLGKTIVRDTLHPQKLEVIG